MCEIEKTPLPAATGGTEIAMLAVDLDGTLVGARRPVSPRNIRALRSARDAGLTIVFCTGRAVREAEPVRRQCFADGERGYYLACLSGAHICEGCPPRTVRTSGIDPAAVAAGMEVLADAGLSAVALVDPCTDGFDNIILPGADERFVYESWLNHDRFVVREIAAAADLLRGDWPAVLRLTAIVPNDRRELADPVVAALNERLGRQLRVEPIYAPNLDIYVIECFAPAIDKLRAVQFLAARHGLGMRRVAAVGDDVNDQPLIAGAALGAAMANACPSVRQAANHHTGECLDDGLAEFVERLLTGELDTHRREIPEE